MIKAPGRSADGRVDQRAEAVNRSAARQRLDRIISGTRRCRVALARDGKPKVRWDSEAQAGDIIRLMDVASPTADVRRSYPCVSCGGWHITAVRELTPEARERIRISRARKRKRWRTNVKARKAAAASMPDEPDLGTIGCPEGCTPATGCLYQDE